MPTNMQMQSISGIITRVRATSGQIPTPLVGASMTVVDDRIFVFGGRLVSSRKMSNHLYVLDLTTNVWTKHVPSPDSDKPPKPRYFHSASVYKNLLIIFGGMGHSRISAEGLCVLDDICIFDIETMSWRRSNVTPSLYTTRPRYAHLAAVTDDKLVIMGGQDMDNNYLEEINVFDIKALEWVQTQTLDRHIGAYRSIAVTTPPGTRLPIMLKDTLTGRETDSDADADTNAPLTDKPPGLNNRASTVRQYGEPLQNANDPHPIFFYTNYNFADVKRELHLILSPGSSPLHIEDCSASMTGSVMPPGLRFPTGHTLGHHLILSGTYLSPQAKSYTLWALNFSTLSWSRIETGNIFNTGSWNRGTLHEKTNQFIVFGHPGRDLLEDYNHRQVNFDYIAAVDLEAFGIYRLPKMTCSSLAQEMGLSLLNEPAVSDFRIITRENQTIPVNSAVLAQRWPYFEDLMKSNRKSIHVPVSTVVSNPSSERRVSVTSNSEEAPSLAGDKPVVEDESINKEGQQQATITTMKCHSMVFPYPYPVVIALLQFIYTDNLLTAQQYQPHVLSQLLLLADMYKLPRLRELAAHALHQMLNMSTAPLIFETAALSHHISLQIRALKMMIAAKKMIQQQQQQQQEQQQKQQQQKLTASESQQGSSYATQSQQTPSTASEAQNGNQGLMSWHQRTGRPTERSVREVAGQSSASLSTSPLQTTSLQQTKTPPQVLDSSLAYKQSTAGSSPTLQSHRDRAPSISNRSILTASRPSTPTGYNSVYNPEDMRSESISVAPSTPLGAPSSIAESTITTSGRDTPSLFSNDQEKVVKDVSSEAERKSTSKKGTIVKEKDQTYEIEWTSRNGNDSECYEGYASANQEFECLLIFDEESQTFTLEKQAAKLTMKRSRKRKLEPSQQSVRAISTDPTTQGRSPASAPPSMPTPTPAPTTSRTTQPVDLILPTKSTPTKTAPQQPQPQQYTTAASDDDDFDISKDMDEILGGDDDDDEDDEEPKTRESITKQTTRLPPQDTTDKDSHDNDTFEEIVTPSVYRPPATSDRPPSLELPTSSHTPVVTPNANKRRKYKMASAPIRHPDSVSPHVAAPSPSLALPPTLAHTPQKSGKTPRRVVSPVASVHGSSDESGSDSSGSGSSSSGSENDSDSSSGSSSDDDDDDDDDDIDMLADDISRSLSKEGPSEPSSPQSTFSQSVPQARHPAIANLNRANVASPGARSATPTSNRSGGTGPMSLKAMFNEEDEDEGLSSSSSDND
ncbi:uncharacterized protein BYT42DRAFT_604484 [Radiomyces spectabilis]|uniref:uncharacterized protein n=1 Tax=Radiomyces spectabilis TaxID=64574 RepID=UPI00221E572D|nr:uncharacterized protein BYT42DRAFT_604484 [Radiomyces spectabilis]KAI8381559.1 hypothetical protein BYT42DRAFT_604484 [Radiomyces spectabilis]